MQNYKALINKQTFGKIESYLQALKSDDSAGHYLSNQLKDRDISQLTKIDLLQLLISTKRPQIFAESEIYGDGTDWNQTELSILGDISIATPVTIYDNEVVYYDPYSECENERFEIGNISLLIRPLTKGNNNKPQLCQPEIYAEGNDNFNNALATNH